MDRRSLLRSSMYFTVVSATASLAACGGSDTDNAAEAARESFSFPLGVASGDPKDSSVVFWTRVLSAKGLESSPVRLEVSTSDTFATIVASADLSATGQFDSTVRVKVTALSPATRYFYRFVAGQDKSVVGTTKTAPAAATTPAHMKFAWRTCQDWSVNHWAAMDLIAAEELDFLVHLGDYIYETWAPPRPSGGRDTLKGSNASWKVWGNEVTLNRMWFDLRASAPAPYNNQYVVNADTWDGYPTHKAELMTFLKTNGIKNVVAITGDLHAFQCGTIRDNPDPALGTPVAVDFVSAGISSDSFYRYLKSGAGSTPLAPLVATPQTFDAAIRGNNPEFAYTDHDAQGFAVATVTANAFTVMFHKVKPLNADGSKPSSPLQKRTRITLALGSTSPVVEDNV